MKLEEAIKSTKFIDAKHKATLNLLYTSYWLKNHFSVAIKGKGLTMEQYNVLRILKGKHPQQMCVKDIGSRMIEKNSNVPRILERLIIKKLVKKTISDEDRRETLIALTPKGVDLLDETLIVIDKLNAGIMGLDEQESEQLNTLLEKMRLVD